MTPLRLSDRADTTFNISFPLDCAVKQWYNYKALTYLSRLYPKRPGRQSSNDDKVKYDHSVVHLHVFPFGMADDNSQEEGLPFACSTGDFDYNF